MCARLGEPLCMHTVLGLFVVHQRHKSGLLKVSIIKSLSDVLSADSEQRNVFQHFDLQGLQIDRLLYLTWDKSCKLQLPVDALRKRENL